MSMICPNCGAENADENRICEVCGESLSTEQKSGNSRRKSGGSFRRNSGSSLKRSAGSSLRRKPGSLLNQRSEDIPKKNSGGSFLNGMTITLNRSDKKGSGKGLRELDDDFLDDDLDMDESIDAADEKADAGNAITDTDGEKADVNTDADSGKTDTDSDSDAEIGSDSDTDTASDSEDDDPDSDLDDDSFNDRKKSSDKSSGEDDIDSDFEDSDDDSDSEDASSSKDRRSRRGKGRGRNPGVILIGGRGRNRNRNRDRDKDTDKDIEKDTDKDKDSDTDQRDGRDSRRSSLSLKERRAASLKRKRQQKIMKIRIAVVVAAIVLLLVIVFSIKRSVNNYIRNKEQQRYDELHATIDMVTLSPEEQEKSIQQRRMYEAAVDAASNKTGRSTEDEFDEFEAKETTAQLRTYLFGQQNCPDWKIYCSPTKMKTGLGTVAIRPEAQFKAGRLSYLFIMGALYYQVLSDEMYEPFFLDDLQIMLTGTTWTEEYETIILEIPDPEDPDALPEIEERTNRYFTPTEDGEGDADEAALRLLALLGAGDPSFGCAYIDRFTEALGLTNTTMGSAGDLSDAYTTAKDIGVYYKALFNSSILSDNIITAVKELINKHENPIGIGEKSSTLLFTDSTDEYEIIACILNPNGSPTALVLQAEGPGLKLDHDRTAAFKDIILTELANRKE